MQYKTIVTQRAQLSDHMVFAKLKLAQPHEMEFKAGQFISITVGIGIMRMYSIASPPSQKNELDIIADIKAGGPGSKFFESLKEGDEVKILGPLGQFVLKEPADRSIIFACTGSGIAPFLSMIRDLLEKGFEKDIQLFFGLRYETDQFYMAELEELEKKYSNFHLQLTLSRPTAQWKGKIGYITKWMDEIPNDQFNSDIYICGWKEIIDSVIGLCKKKGLPDSQIHFENYG